MADKPTVEPKRYKIWPFPVQDVVDIVENKLEEKPAKNKSHFRDIKQSYKDKKCKDPEHHPPTMIHIPIGKEYVHICPSCGNQQILRSHFEFAQF